MRKNFFLVTFILMSGFMAGPAVATDPANQLNEPGSILVFPLIDNLNNTVVEITNTHPTREVWLGGYMIVHPPERPEDFVKSDFKIHLTPKEVFWWDTGQAIPQRGLQSFEYMSGFMFVWAIDGPGTALEIAFNYLKGDAIVYDGRAAFQYNAIPHQALSVAPDRVLNLDGAEYTMATSQIQTEGFSDGFLGIEGRLAVCSLDIDFIHSYQPEFNINIMAWNENEQSRSKHLNFYQFAQYAVGSDLDLSLNTVFTPKWHLATSSTGALWAVMYQRTGGLMWGSNVFQNSASARPARVVLPPLVY